jgi:putative transcriptional regulator
MTPNHHPFPETLISFASGTLPSAISAVVASHLSMCRVCAQDVRRLERVGGAMLNQIETRAVEMASAEHAVERWATRGPSSETEHAPRTQSADPLLPSLLARHFPVGGEILWENVSPGVREHRLALSKGSGQLRLLRLTPGQFLPQRARRADAQLALVLRGVLSRASGDDFVRGDVIEWAEEGDEEPRAAGDIDCVCLIASDPGVSATAESYPRFRDLREKAVPLTLRAGGALARSGLLLAGLTLFIGIGLGWLVRGAPETGTVASLVKADGGRLIAQGALRDVLDVLPSGRETAASLDGGDFRLGVKMTFEDQSGDYCRQYEIIASPSGLYSGIACRTGAEWAVKIQALLPLSRPASGQIVPAGANAAMDAVIGAWISGNPLVGQDEAVLMSRSWKK